MSGVAQQGTDGGDILFDVDVEAWSSSPLATDPRTTVSPPSEITCYSSDENYKVSFGCREQLKTFTNPELPVNLGDKFEALIPYLPDSVGVERILKSLLVKSFDVDGQVGILTYQRNLKNIGLTPYQQNIEWEIDCALVDNTVFMDIRDTEEPPYRNQELYMYYGVRFESLCTGESEKPVNENVSFYSASLLEIGNHKIVLASEIDCCTEQSENGSNPLETYIELKTMKAIASDRALYNMYKHRFLKIWLQAYLAGVKKILLGIRSESGELLEAKRLKTEELPREAREYFQRERSYGRWDPRVCLNFIGFVLSSISDACHAHPQSTIRVRFDPWTKHVTAFLVAGPDEGLTTRIMSVRQECESE